MINRKTISQYSLLTLLFLAGCSLLGNKKPPPTVLLTIDSSDLNSGVLVLPNQNIKLEIFFLVKSTFLNAKTNEQLDYLFRSYSDKADAHRVVFYYDYFIVPDNSINERVEMDQNVRLITLVLKNNNQILAKKDVNFDRQKTKALNIRLADGLIVVN